VAKILESDTRKTSVLECRVYAQLKIGGEHFIGGTKDTFESLLAESASGG
jgi:hypothetical protein